MCLSISELCCCSSVLDLFRDHQCGQWHPLFISLFIFFLQIMLLLLCPLILEEIINADNGAPCSEKRLKKKHFIDNLKRALAGQRFHQAHMAWGLQRDSETAAGCPPYGRPPLKWLQGCFKGGLLQGIKWSGMAGHSD
jgi:hypothetical protein